MEKIRQYLLTNWFNVKKNWHTNLFDVFFILVSFIFFPLFYLVYGLFENFVNEEENRIFVFLLMAILQTLIIFCRVSSIYLKRFAVQLRIEKFKSGQRLLVFNLVAIILFYLSAIINTLMSITEFYTTEILTLSNFVLVLLVLLLILLVVAIPFDIIFFFKLDKPLNQEDKLFAKKWFSNPFTEFFADCLLFIYILFCQLDYYSSLDRSGFRSKLADFTIGNGKLGVVISSIIYLGGLFLLYYVAPRMIYSETYKENGTNRLMLFLVFVCTLFAHLMPYYISWLF